MILAIATALLISQIPCTPGESTIICGCKQGNASACTLLMETKPELARQIEQALAVAATGADAALKEKEKEKAESISDCGDPNNCNGQEHHIISKTIWKALDKHPTLSGKYKSRDPRFVSQAKSKQDHCGYQEWHRDIEREVVAWLNRQAKATPAQFEAFLRELYKRADLARMFPNGF
jgi:hypothetical protein